MFATVLRGEGDEDKLQLTQEELDAKIAEGVKAAVDERTKGLKATNEQLKNEKVAVQSRLDGIEQKLAALGGEEGIDALVKERERLSKDSLGKLLAEAKYEEWYEARSKAAFAEAERKLTTATERGDEFEGKYNDLLRDTRRKDLHAEVVSVGTEMKVNADVLTSGDAQRAADSDFKWSDDHGRMVMVDRDDLVLLKADGKTPQGVAEWLEAGKDGNRKHWWKGSTSGGAGGDDEHGGTGNRGLEGLSYKEYEKRRDKTAAAT